jgi:2-dehydropantoate 2-reductase
MVDSLCGSLLLGKRTMEANKRIGVIGAGAIGSILSAHLARSGREVVLIESGPRLAQVKQHGLTIGGVLEVATQRPLLLASVDALHGMPLQALFICTKAWSLPSLLPPLARALDPAAVVVSYQNGIGPEDDVAAHFERARVCRGIVNYAGGVVEGGERVTVAWSTPPNYLGPLEPTSDHAGELARTLTAAGLETTAITAHEIKKKVFWKAILNAALSPLCASTGITMRRAMTLKHTRDLATRLVREAIQVAAAAGFDYGENAVADAMGYLDRGGDHMPSMWTDLQHDLPTEIDSINGKIVELGKRYGNVEVSANAFITSMIVTLEIKSGARTPDRIPEYLTNS